MGDAADIAADGDKLKGTRAVYGGKAVAVYQLERRPGVAWIRARLKRRHHPGQIRPTSNTSLPLPIPSPRRGSWNVRPKFMKGSGSKTPAGLSLAVEDSADLNRLNNSRNSPTPSAPRLPPREPPAMPAGFPLLGKSAKQANASRPICTSPWEFPAPVNISSALPTPKSSLPLTSINTPIFKHCRFGIVEDYKKVVGLLKEKLLAMKG